MRTMKRFISILLVLVLAFGFAACGGDDDKIDLDPEVDAMEGTSDTYGTVEVTASKTAYNPLTGLSNMASDRVGMRPYAISVDNISQAWPQRGISQADVIVEIETEGGITRLMALYMDTREVPLIGPVRSLRTQFMEVVYPIEPIIVHIGAAPSAEEAIAEHNFRTMNLNLLTKGIWFDRARNATSAQEHCSFTSGSLIEAQFDNAHIKPESTTNVRFFNFADEGTTITPTGGAATNVTFDFSSYGDGDFRYDAESGKYLKYQYGGKPHVDEGNENKQLAFDNVLILFADIQLSEDHVHVVANYLAGGDGYYFSQGQYQHITWQKDDYSNPFRFFADDGTELVINPGISYLGIVRNTFADTLEIQ